MEKKLEIEKHWRLRRVDSKTGHPRSSRMHPTAQMNVGLSAVALSSLEPSVEITTGSNTELVDHKSEHVVVLV